LRWGVLPISAKAKPCCRPIWSALAPFFLANRELQLRMRAICFAFLTPFYFLKAGSLIEAHALIAGASLIGLFSRHEDDYEIFRDSAADALF
jgi:hypothetical protein